MTKSLPVVIFLAAAMLPLAAFGVGPTTTTAPSASTRPGGLGSLLRFIRGEQAQPAPQHFRGKVLDEQTGKPVAAFRLVPGIAYSFNGNEQPAQWQRVSSRDFSNGAYDFASPIGLPDNSSVTATVSLRVEADGYEPATSPAFAYDGKDHTYDFKLKAGKNVTGIVLTPDGKPAANARVMLLLPGEGWGIQISQPAANGQVLQTTSDTSGKFSFFPQTGNYALVAMHDSGWGQVNQDAIGQGGAVKLQPWGRIDGVAMVGSKPQAKVQIQMQCGSRAYDPTQPMINPMDLKVTDKDGKFTFDRVPAGQVTVSRLSNGNNGYAVASETLAVKAGQTVAVQLGGKGRPIIGQVVKPAGVKGAAPALQGYLEVQPVPAEPSAELLAAGKKMQQTMADPEISPSEKETWSKQWSATAEGQAFQKAMNAYQQSMFQQVIQPLMLTIAADGTFRADDVQPADYQLFIYQLQASADGSGQIYASVQREFKVSGRSDEPLDLGKLELAAATAAAAAGAVAPPLTSEAKTLEGQTFKLVDQRGKYVLLDLWATWTPLSDSRQKALNEVFAAFGQDKRFVMIGLGAGESAQAVKLFAQQRPMPWLQASLDETAATAFAGSLGVQSLPAVVLIGPDGKVIAAGLRGAAIKTAVQAALKAP